MNSVFLLLLLVPNIGIHCASLKKEAKDSNTKGPMEKILLINEEKDLFEGDIVMPPLHANSKNAIIDPNLKWTTNIPYVLHSEFTFEIKQAIENVLREYSVRLCVNFVPRQNENNYLIFKKESGCYSSVGMVGNEQIVSIGSGCEGYGIIIHEVMHALGFWHEHSRYDRDDFVKIMWENIQSGKEHNFNKFSEQEITLLDEPYDYSSILHYYDTAFSSNGEPTIVALQPGGENMGQRNGFSEIDLRKLRKLYQCDSVVGWTKWTEWSSCDKECKKERKRFCEGESCTTEKETETTICDDSSCVVGVDRDCPESTLAANYGMAKSTMFPFNYKVDAECIQTITVPDGEVITLEFEFMDIEDYEGICYYDWLKIYDGKDTNSPPIGTYCGKKNPPAIRSKGNHLTLGFFSDSSITQKGFLANFYSSISFSPLGMCHFEGDISACGWTHDLSADFQWSRNYGTTVSSETGPSYDHTTGEDKGYYMFIETSSPQTNGMVARMLTPTYPAPTAGHCLEFYYNMFGENVDTLSVILQQQISESSTESMTIFSIMGNQGNDDWYSSRINIYGQYPYKLAFQGRRGNGYKGDLAIDDVTLHSVSCSDLN